MSNPQKPGETPDKPGEYELRGPRGGQVDKPRQVTITLDDGHLPPTPKPNQTWVRTGKAKGK